MVYLLTTECAVEGVFSTALDAINAKSALVDKEVAEWLSSGEGLDEILSEATQEEYAKYCKGEMSVEEFHHYSKLKEDWADCFYITQVPLNRLHTVNLN